MDDLLAGITATAGTPEEKVTPVLHEIEESCPF